MKAKPDATVSTYVTVVKTPNVNTKTKQKWIIIQI